MTCNRCRHNREIARLVQEQGRLREICSKCRLGDDIQGDASVSLDTIQDGTLGRVVKVAPNVSTSYTFDPGTIDERPGAVDEKTQTMDALTTLLACVASLPYAQLARLVAVAKVFEQLERQEFEIVAHLLGGGTMIGYAEAHGLTKQTAHARIKTLFRKFPIFRSIATGLLTHGKGGRQATPTEPRQLDFMDILEGS